MLIGRECSGNYKYHGDYPKIAMIFFRPCFAPPVHRGALFVNMHISAICLNYANVFSNG